MQNKYSLILTIFLIISLAIGFSTGGRGVSDAVEVNETSIQKQNEMSKLISERKNRSYFTEFSILKKSSRTTLESLNEFTNKADIFELNKSQLKSLHNTSPQDIILKIDSKEYGLFELEITRLKFAPDYLNIRVINGNSITNEKFRTGLAYSGIIKGEDNSFVSITAFEDCVMGIICNSKGDFVLGPKKDVNKKFSNEYVFYNDDDLVIKSDFKCGVDDYSPLHQKGLSLKKRHVGGGNSYSNSVRDTSIRVYFVADYQMYLDNGSSTTQTGIFINSVFNNVSTIYALEAIPASLAPSISVYTNPDPYTNLNDSYEILNLFGANTQDNFDGDLAHLLSTGHNQQLGGIAWVNVLCQPYVYIASQNAHYGRYAFSNIENSYMPYPTYSWTVEVVTHEIGHNIASKHTHACVWPTISGQIDSCYASEGNCVIGTWPNTNGSIMSYCHLNGAINLVNGFGPLPRDTIQLGYYMAGCLDTAVNSSEFPLAYDLLQNFPNPFNPGTNIRFALPEAGYVTLKIYDVTGREITALANSQFYEAGLFTSNFNASDYNLASGVYLYKIDVKNDNNSVYSQIKKMVLVK